MAAIRRNILTDTQARNQFKQGVAALDQEMSGVTAQDVVNFLANNSIPLTLTGRNQEFSTYDLFVLWHMIAMSIPMAPGNAAHSGPIFLPWHRMYLVRLEQELQRVLNDPEFGMPYWDWAADGELAAEMQWRTDLWTADGIGEARGSVTSGDLGQVRVRLVQGGSGLFSIEPLFLAVYSRHHSIMSTSFRPISGVAARRVNRCSAP